MTALARCAGTVLTALRRAEPTVVWAPSEGLGFGNVLYLWLHAHVESRRGRPTVVLLPPAMRGWVEALPSLAQLSVDRQDVGPWNRRTWGWWSAFGTDFDRGDLDRFVRECLLSSPAFRARSAAAASDAGLLTVNVRRGNYYSEAHFRGTYSFDVPEYLVLAVGLVRERRPVTRVHVVSDGIEWCRRKLDGQLREVASEVTYCAPTDTPLQNFLECATSPALVGTNSTFSYWAGYVGGTLHGPGSCVVAPRFHARLGASHDAYQLDPTWSVVEDIPGGWDS